MTHSNQINLTIPLNCNKAMKKRRHYDILSITAKFKSLSFEQPQADLTFMKSTKSLVNKK